MYTDIPTSSKVPSFSPVNHHFVSVCVGAREHCSHSFAFFAAYIFIDFWKLFSRLFDTLLVGRSCLKPCNSILFPSFSASFWHYMGEALISFLNSTFKMKVTGTIDKEKASPGEEIIRVNIEESFHCQ